MKFGPVPLEAALGAILAHSVQVPGGRLRKGRVLTGDDINRLTSAGLTEVTVAQLEANDVHEDTAAQQLGAAIVPDPQAAGLRLGAAGTGRVNFFSDVVGVAEIDAAAVNAANAIDPMITIATVPQWQRMGPGGMVATVKIISYGVDEGALARVCAAASGAIRMRQPVLKTAAFVQTRVPGDDAEKGHEASKSRLAALSVNMSPKRVVPHDVADLATELTRCEEDLILILTASATSDLRDTAPMAVVAAGGTITHFGMPVDPGNLLFLGEIAGKPVIGLPGCARSPALNGADWVLERIVCGVPVTSEEIAGMGVGGLLKEIPTRPHPRRKSDT